MRHRKIFANRANLLFRRYTGNTIGKIILPVQKLVQYTELGNKACMWFREICSCYCLAQEQISPNHVQARDVTNSGLESAPEYEFGSLASIFKSDSGSGSF